MIAVLHPAFPRRPAASTPPASRAVRRTLLRISLHAADAPRGQAQPMRLPDVALALAASQTRCCRRDQLLAAGVSSETLRWRIGRDWRLTAARRLCPADGTAFAGAAARGRTARRRRGLLVGGYHRCGPARPEVLLAGAAHPVAGPAASASRRFAWVERRATSLLGEPVVERGPLRSAPPRAVVDAPADARRAECPGDRCLESVQRRLVRLDDLEHWIDARGRRGSLRLRAPAGRDRGRRLVPESRSAHAPPHLAQPARADGATRSSPARRSYSPRPTCGSTTWHGGRSSQSRQFHSERPWTGTRPGGWFGPGSTARVVVVGVTLGARP